MPHTHQPLTETHIRTLLEQAQSNMARPTSVEKTMVTNGMLIRLKDGVVGSGSCPCLDAVTCPIIRARESIALLYLAWLRGKGEHESAEVMAAQLYGLMQQTRNEPCQRSTLK